LLTVVVIVAVGIVVAVILAVAVVVGVVIVAVIVCADAAFLANARKGMLAALTAVALSSCRRVRTRCSLLMSAPVQVERGFQIAEKLISMSIYQAV
jgi:hypothetical protein